MSEIHLACFKHLKTQKSQISAVEGYFPILSDFSTKHTKAYKGRV